MKEELLIKRIKAELWQNSRDLVAIENVDNSIKFIYNNYEVVINKKPLSK